jgi:transposase
MPTPSGRRHIKKLLALVRDDAVDFWALDEVRFEQHGSACRMWVAPEIKDPVLLHHPTRKGIGYFGAVRIRDGKFVYSREEKRFNAETFFTFLKKLRRVACCTGRQVVLILDNVRYHHACLHRKWRDKHGKRFALEFMPPYSPELNPIERVWKLTRRMATHNQYFPTLELIGHSVETVFDQWQRGSVTLKRLCAL